MGEERLVPEAELQACYERSLDLLVERRGSRQIGDYLEFGVYVGSSLLCMHRALASRGLTGVRLIGFDSFEGLPPSASNEDEGAWRAGDYSSDLATTRNRLAREGVDFSRLHLVPGWFDETLTQKNREKLGLERAGVIMIDCDVYSSAKAALEFCAPLIDDSIVLFDDWHSENLAARGLGEKRAFDEFRAAHRGLNVREVPGYSPNAAVFHITRKMSGSEPER
jgi:O-methyltransferase